jgi:hypothetical protein
LCPESHSPQVVSPSFINSALKNEIWKIPLQIFVFSTKIKWKGEFSEGFTIEQGVRQGGTLSADLYKIYVNQLLDILDCAGVGAKIGPSENSPFHFILVVAFL